jgi:hypothetical protein
MTGFPSLAGVICKMNTLKKINATNSYQGNTQLFKHKQQDTLDANTPV